MEHNLIEDRREYPLGHVKTAEVGLQILHGSLALAGGSDAFCSALFEYSHPELRPLDTYSADGDKAELEIREPETHQLRERRNSWRLAFNSEVAIAMAIESMSGSVDLDLDRVRLSDLEFKSRSGRVRAGLAGNYPELDEFLIDSTSGKVDVVMSGGFPTLSSVDIKSTSGATELAITGRCPNLRSVDVNSMSGHVNVDLRGSFERDDLGVDIECTSGHVKVLLPVGVGASMNASTMSGKIRADGFNSGSGRWTNAAFGSSTATIWLNIRVMSGSVDVTTG